MTTVTGLEHRVFYSCFVKLPRPIAARVLLSLLTLACLSAQSQTDKASPLTVQGSFRSRVEAWDWFEGGADNSYAFSGNLLRLSLVQQRKQIDWQTSRAVTLSAYFGYASSGEVIKKIYPKRKNGSLGYLELTYRF